jgi:hypothetical protein
VTTDNIYKVPKSAWKKWSDPAKETFNDVYEMLIHNQHLFIHPKTPLITQDFWKTTAWNVAWVATEQVDKRND